mgnify:CR=1 FL=1
MQFLGIPLITQGPTCLLVLYTIYLELQDPMRIYCIYE